MKNKMKIATISILLVSSFSTYATVQTDITKTKTSVSYLKQEIVMQKQINTLKETISKLSKTLKSCRQKRFDGNTAARSDIFFPGGQPE
tara:strand:- start:11715 stop:11981 length:267 start_codon:yes stop_codon:yes gene_type:complete